MKLIHLSDLHLGKRVNEFSLLEDQQYILTEILQIIDREAPDGVLIAGDVYDKPVPSAEAVALLDDFLVRLSGRKLRTFVISGNHDSPERMAFGGRLMAGSGVHLAPVYDGRVEPITLTDQYGPVNLYLLPFVKPAHVRRWFPQREIATYTDALATAIEAMGVDTAARNVLVTHQFVTGAVRCDSEEVSVGGADNVDVSVFAPFDYVALGHIHGPQRVERETVRYCGTPLKYSFSEAGQQKSVTVVELGAKGNVAVRTVPLTPMRDMVELKGTYETLTLRDFYEGAGYPGDYVHITLTDEDDIPDAVSKLRVIYPYLMKLDYDNTRTRAGGVIDSPEDRRDKSPLELLEEFYEKQNGRPMAEAQRDFARDLMERIWEGEA
ncbi:exonuclease SbcCD subunit D [uncultured Pseudoflavonifractor sp.]|uniref:exonuclease SbcCD subunit D n=1 Tax=uncultured Pseudoflavonifractor sp. TaxID=1221379 RepID=UPI0025E6CA22|nr:exonuclease SbcCD subunit D [uncultured Pseudoflavonifractor sp.]